MSLTLLIIVLIVGLVLLTLEIVALPGGISGIFGIGLIIYSIWQGYNLYGSTTGNIMLISGVVACIALLSFFLKTKTWRRFSLDAEVDSKVNEVDKHNIHVGARGTTVARLAPTGRALIDGELVEVHAVNKFIDQDKPIEVIAVDGYRIDVREIGDTRFENK